MNAAPRTRPPALLAPVACTFAGGALAVALRVPLSAKGAHVVPVAVLFDFTFTVPFLWWLLAVRGRGASVRSLALVFAASMVGARVLVGHRTPVTSA